MNALKVEGASDAMELIGLHDELSRVERKWREKAAGEHAPKRPTPARPPANASRMDERFAQLTWLIDAALRRGVVDEAERRLLESIAATLKVRVPLA